MSTNGNKFHKYAHKAQTGNEKEAAQEDQTTNANNAFEFPEHSSVESKGFNSPEAPEDRSQNVPTQLNGAVVPAGNQDKSDGWKALVPVGIRNFLTPRVSQGQLLDVDPNFKSYDIMYKSLIERSTKTPHIFKFYSPVHTITGISCLPKDAATSSPECQIVAGGIGHKEVEIVLTPVVKDWSCWVQINGIQVKCVDMNRVPNKTTGNGTNGNAFHEFTHKAQTGNEKESAQEAAQEDQTTNANNTFEFPEHSSVESKGFNSPEAPEDRSQSVPAQLNGAVVLAGNQDKSGGWKGMVPAVLNYFSPPVSQFQFVELDPNIESYDIIYRSVIERCTETPYTFKYYDPVHIITGIACVPKDAATSSPKCEIVAGGIGNKEVKIVLTPVQRGNWSCCVQINGIQENCLEMGKVPDQ